MMATVLVISLVAMALGLPTCPMLACGVIDVQ
jgi:hypothetical protein